VPVTRRKDGKFTINWKLIDRVVEYTRDRLDEVALPIERHIQVAKYDLEEIVKRDRTSMVKRLWDQKFQGNRYVVLGQDESHKIWDKTIDLNQSKRDRKQEIEHFKEQYREFMTLWRNRKSHRQEEQAFNFLQSQT